MKAGAEHRVPLSPRAVALLEALRDGCDSVIPERRLFKIGHHAMDRLLKRHGVTGVTVHGMRSAFRDWCADETSFPSEIPEAALAHTVGNQVQRAYQRTDFFDRRRELMSAWANYCSGADHRVISIAARR
jgi:integrase